MSNLDIDAGSHGTPTTVSEMRCRLARLLSHLEGGQEITFSFHARIENYRPNTNDLDRRLAAGETGIPKIPDGPDTRQCYMLDILEGLYDLSDVQRDDPYIEFVKGLWGGYSARLIKSSTVILGPLARPENS